MLETLAFDNGKDGGTPGWISRYSFHPDWMVGFKSKLYTFKNGEIYSHGTNQNRNEFYGVAYSSSVKTVLNDAATEVKMFKTLGINSNDAWSATYDTDMGQGYNPHTYFEKKEDNYFSYLRRLDSLTISDDDSKLRSTMGLGTVLSFTNPVITFSTDIDLTTLAIGDRIYKIVANAFVYVGDVSSYTLNTVTLSTGTVAPNDFIIVAKNKAAESYGMRGFYLNLELTTDIANKNYIELFSVKSSIFKSFP
jgi:hypothetical protein